MLKWGIETKTESFGSFAGPSLLAKHTNVGLLPKNWFLLLVLYHYNIIICQLLKQTKLGLVSIEALSSLQNKRVSHKRKKLFMKKKEIIIMPLNACDGVKSMLLNVMQAYFEDIPEI